MFCVRVVTVQQPGRRLWSIPTIKSRAYFAFNFYMPSTKMVLMNTLISTASILPKKAHEDHSAYFAKTFH